MAKDPAFLFYPSDFLSGTQIFSNEEVGLYIRLLCMQFASPTGSLTLEEIKRTMNGCFDKSWEFPLRAKFKVDDNGFYNTRLREEQIKRRNYSESRRENRKSKNDTSKEDMINISKSCVERMGNGNGNEDYNSYLSNTDLPLDVQRQRELRKIEFERTKEFTLEKCIEIWKEFNQPERIAKNYFDNYSSFGWINANNRKIVNLKSHIATLAKDPEKIKWLSGIKKEEKTIIFNPGY